MGDDPCIQQVPELVIDGEKRAGKSFRGFNAQVVQAEFVENFNKTLSGIPFEVPESMIKIKKYMLE